MRIALVVHKFPPASLGGTEIYTLNLARELARWGHEVFVFYRDDRAAVDQTGVAWQQRDGFRTCQVSRASRSSATSPLAQFLDTFSNRDVELAFHQFLDEAKPDLVHFQHVMLLSYRLIEQTKRLGLPALLTLHDYWFLCSISQLVWPDARVCQGKALGLNCARCVLAARLPSPLLKLVRPLAAPLLQARDRLVRGAALQADRLIAPSRFLVGQYINAGFPPDRFAYLENGLDVQRIQRYRHQPSPDGRMRFAFLGSLAWQKGVHILVEAFRDIPAERASLRIYGDPEVFPEYAARLEQGVDKTNTFFEGLVANEEVGRVLAETDMLVVPSLWYENSPVVIQEAFAAGVPVLASRLGALTEKVRHRVDGLLFAPGDVNALREDLRFLTSQPAHIENLRSQVPTPQTTNEHVTALQELYRHSSERSVRSDAH